MRIFDKRTDPFVHFSSLSKGEMFLSNGEPFLKIDPIQTPHRIFNAVDLIDGNPWTFGGEEVIEKVGYSELVVKG